jgi:MYXO-CTERM domain-containing protein
VVIDSQSDIVRIGSDVRGHVYLWNATSKDWELSGRVTLPEGWYAGPMHAQSPAPADPWPRLTKVSGAAVAVAGLGVLGLMIRRRWKRQQVPPGLRHI